MARNTKNNKGAVNISPQPQPLVYKEIKDVAALFHVTTRTIQNWLSEEDENLRLTGVFLGNKWIFEDDDIVDFINRRRQYGEQTQQARKARHRGSFRSTSAEMPAVTKRDLERAEKAL